MKIIKSFNILKKEINYCSNIGFVPTMGSLHQGHVSLIKLAKKKNKKVLVSIFVNPTQFNEKKDFIKYPRNLKKDIALLKKLKINYLFLPNENEIYKALGTGDAVLKTKKLITGSHFLILFPDDLILKKNCSKEMISLHKKFNCSVMASIKVNKKNVSRWGIFSIKKKISKKNFLINDVVEKPKQNEAPSNNAVIGRYILPVEIFKKLEIQNKGIGGEIHITDSIRKLIFNNFKFIGHNFAGKYLDCGTMDGYIKSSLEISKL